MNNYIFLTDNNSQETNYEAISADRIETLKVHATYNDYGQQVGHENAGDYHFDNQYSDAIKDCNEALVAAGLLKNTDEIVWTLEIDVAKIEDLYGENEGCDKEAIEKFAAQWRSENETFIECEGFDYWDGHNWKTVTTKVDFGEPSHRIVEDEKLIAELNAALEGMELVKEGFGKKIYESGEWNIISTQFADDCAAYTFVPVGYLEVN